LRHTPATGTNRIRSSALWGKGGRGLVTLLVTVVALTAVPVAATAEKRPASPPGQGNQGQGSNSNTGPTGSPPAPLAALAFVDPALRGDARAHPGAKFRVVVQGSSTQGALESVVKAVTLTGGRLLALAKSRHVKSITPRWTPTSEATRAARRVSTPRRGPRPSSRIRPPGAHRPQARLGAQPGGRPGAPTPGARRGARHCGAAIRRSPPPPARRGARRGEVPGARPGAPRGAPLSPPIEGCCSRLTGKGDVGIPNPP
jgi:hypothetical protein